jgi:hypothetical protein
MDEMKITGKEPSGRRAVQHSKEYIAVIAQRSPRLARIGLLCGFLAIAGVLIVGSFVRMPLNIKIPMTVQKDQRGAIVGQILIEHKWLSNIACRQKVDITFSTTLNGKPTHVVGGITRIDTMPYQFKDTVYWRYNNVNKYHIVSIEIPASALPPDNIKSAGMNATATIMVANPVLIKRLLPFL